MLSSRVGAKLNSIFEISALLGQAGVGCECSAGRNSVLSRFSQLLLNALAGRILS
jgi:hypothetical protein